jgi:hypothetical protein
VHSGHHIFEHGAVLGAVNALRCASTARTARPSGIDRAVRSGQPGIYVMAAALWRNPAVTRGWRACNITRKLSYLPL